MATRSLRRRFRRFAAGRWADAVWNALRAWFFARDVFISYSHAEPLYAERLAERLREKKRRVASYLDQDASWSTARTPRDILWHARHSRVVVAVATPAAVASPAVRTEVRVAARSIVVAVENGEYGPRWSHPVWRRARGSTAEMQTLDELRAGNVTDAVVARIDRTVGLMRASARLALSSMLALLFLGASIAASWVLLRRANESRARAAVAQKEAETAGRAARASSLAGSALNFIGTPQHREALRLAVQSFDTFPDRPSYVTRSALFRAITRYPAMRRIVLPPEEQRVGAGVFNSQDVRRLRRLPDGRLAMVMGTGIVRIIDLDSGASVDLGDAGDTVFMLDVSPSGRWLATAGNGVLLWNVAGAKPAGVVLPNDSISTVARFASDDRLFSDVHGDTGPAVIEWDISDKSHPKLVRRMPVRDVSASCRPGRCRSTSRLSDDPPRGVSAIDVNPAANLVAVALASGGVAVLDWPSGALRTCHADDNQTVWLTRLTPDGSLLVRSSNHAFSVREARSGKLLHWNCDEAAHDVAVSGPHTAIASERGIDYLLNGKWQHTLHYSQSVLTVEFGDTAQTIVAGSRDEAITVWKTPEPGILRPPPLSFAYTIGTGPVQRVAFSADGATVAAGDHRILPRIADVRTRTLVAQRPLSPVPYAILAGERAEQVHIVDGTKPANVLWRVPLPAGWDPRAAVVSGNGKTVAVSISGGGKGGSLVVWWDVGRAEPRVRIPLTSDDFTCALSHDGRTLAIGRANAVITLHGAVNASVRTLEEVEQLALSADGMMVAAATRVSPEVVLFDTETGLAVGGIARPRDGLAFSPDGRWLALAGMDGVILYDLDPRVWRNHAWEMAR